MDFSEYQRGALRTAAPRDKKNELLHLWYVAVLADYLDLSLEDIATAHLAKLTSRHSRGLLGGTGDNR